MTNPEKNIITANNLLAWNSSHLVSHADLNKIEISRFFAPSFRVKANGIDVQGNYDNYFEFLNTFRASIKSIDYILEDFIVDAFHIVIPLTANIVRIDNSCEEFSAILILEFDDNSKVILWQEVYVEVSHKR